MSLEMAPFDLLLVSHCKYSSILYHFRDNGMYNVKT